MSAALALALPQPGGQPPFLDRHDRNMPADGESVNASLDSNCHRMAICAREVSMSPRVEEILRQIDAVLADPETRAELRELVSLLAARQTEGLARFIEMAAPREEARNLPPAEAARILGTSVRWLYEHAHELECTRRPSPGKLRFDSVGIQRLREIRR